MECQNCKIIVDRKFEFAIRSNNCPACGKYIMTPEKLATYANLKKLLSNNIKDIDTEAVASLIVANFELKQLFKEELQKSSEEGIIEVTENEEIIIEEDPDAEYKERQKKESKKILSKMRDEALGGALKDRYNIGDGENEILLEHDGTGMHEFVNKEKQIQSADLIASGLGGENSFRRGD